MTNWPLVFIVLAICYLCYSLTRSSIEKIDRSSYKKGYYKDLESDQWKAKRERILSRDGHKCQWCGSKTDLQVHHKYYNRYPDGSRVHAWDYPDSALITLCKSCHEKYHKKYQIKSYYRKNGQHFN